MKSLDEIVTRHGSDKGSLLHNYCDVYQSYFHPFREQVRSILEIGVQFGKSLAAWEEYFPNAKILGIDVAQNGLNYPADGRIEFMLADQSNREDLGKVIRKGPFDIIIDDGSHYAHDIITSFAELFESLTPGGFYVIEDLHATYHAEFNPRRTLSAMVYLKDLIDDLNWSGRDMRGSRENKDQIPLTYIERHLEFIHFYKSLCVMKKAL